MQQSVRKRKVRIRENSWLARLAARKLGTQSMAMVVGHTIHLHNTTAAYFLNSRSWLLHELKHVEQYERLGFLGFLWSYALESIRRGNHQNALEAEARLAERDDTLPQRFDLSAYGHILNKA